MNCNFNCLYCIQKGNYLTKNNFTLENLDKLYEWVSKPIIEKKRDITINIFGGEPTLNIKGVLYFLEKMNVLANKLKVKNIIKRLLMDIY
ncbi:4Fe-4S cluster-binding domain-containing protein [Treponema pedis]|uniref:4Fe-4S cluster-binding domain-containing protein n=1 Tax=Treponema pedis TaxID=409322 RepID=UPI0004635666|nr:4Fe-4S cluster-binding domain-containing protein [Treponema pedis]